MAAAKKSRKLKLRQIVLVFIFALLLTACKAETTWQKQYDLGLRYLSESNYEEAVIAFTAAIQVDPKQAPAYVGRGDAYVGLADSTDEEKLTEALADYEQAVALDKECVDAYLGMADVYTRRGNMEKVLEILRKGWEITKSGLLGDRLSELEAAQDPELLDPAFAEREGYQPFSSLSEREQTLIRQVLELLEADDYTAVEPLVSSSGISMALFTMVDGYKLEIEIGQGKGYARINELFSYLPEGSEDTVDLIDGLDIIVQARPMNGEGYQYIFSQKYGEENGLLVSSLNSIVHLKGVCENWQFNGAVTSQMDFSASSEDESIDLAGSMRAQGITQNNVLEWQNGYWEYTEWVNGLFDGLNTIAYIEEEHQYQRNGSRLDETITTTATGHVNGVDMDGNIVDKDITSTGTTSNSYDVPVFAEW